MNAEGNMNSWLISSSSSSTVDVLFAPLWSPTGVVPTSDKAFAVSERSNFLFSLPETKEDGVWNEKKK